MRRLRRRGSGGTLVAAGELRRRWIAIDNSEAAIKTALKRLHKGQSKFPVAEQGVLPLAA